MWGWHDGPDGGGILWMGLMMVLVWLPLILVLVWVSREFGRPPRRPEPPSMQPPTEPDAREVVRRAYARGDIDRERYLQMIRDLDDTKG